MERVDGCCDGRGGGEGRDWRRMAERDGEGAKLRLEGAGWNQRQRARVCGGCSEVKRVVVSEQEM